jgi:cell wall-associated NlpC family hydrolase
MAAHAHLPTLIFRAGTASALTLAAVGGVLIGPGAAPEVEALTPGIRALHVAASKRGAPYQWGAQGPHRFDCSGLTLYAFRRAGKHLPRTAAAQYHRSRPVSASRRQVGDLVFFGSGGGIYHVGIYAGRGRIWHAPKSGSVVRLEKIWTDRVRYGRVW